MKKILIIIAAALVLAVGAGFLGRAALLGHRAADSGKPVLVEIPRGAGLMRVADILAEKGVVDHPRLWVLAAQLSDWQLKPVVMAGEYRLGPSMTYQAIVETVTKGRAHLLEVLIPEGFTMAQIIERLAGAGVLKADEALALSRDKEFIASLGIRADSLEGYLFPETYRFAKKAGARRALTVMARQFKAHWEPLAGAAKASGLDQHQAVTLASIIEGEAAKAEERPLISAVYHNRLAAGMPLQADPTVAYGLPSLDGPLLRKHLTVEHAYNTYLHPGLPPGPICSPGLESLRAALEPAKVKYLYFVARGDGAHEFNRRYADHLKAVRKYRSGR